MKPHILVIDDESEVATTLAELLQTLGYSASSASSLEEALGHLRNQKTDVVISDLHMPAGDGMRLRTLMLADERLENIPFIYMTGKIDEVHTLSEPVLVKPFSSDEVITVLEIFLPKLTC